MPSKNMLPKGQRRRTVKHEYRATRGVEEVTPPPIPVLEFDEVEEDSDAVRTFTARVLDTAGDVGDRALEEFLGHGFTRRNALEVILGIGAYTLSTLANRLTGAPVDEQLRAFA